jgi:hypothetical protein
MYHASCFMHHTGLCHFLLPGSINLPGALQVRCSGTSSFLILYITLHFLLILFRWRLMHKANSKWICTLYVYSILVLVKPILIFVYPKYEFSVRKFITCHQQMIAIICKSVVLYPLYFWGATSWHIPISRAPCTLKPQCIKIKRTVSSTLSWIGI